VNAPNIGYATLSIVPSMRGFDAQLARGLAPAQARARDAGTKSGAEFSKNFESNLKLDSAKFAKFGAAALAAGGLAAAGLFSVGDAFTQATNTIRIGTGATGEALKGLQDDFDAVFGSVPANAADASTAIADLNTRLGITGQPLQELATQFLNLSRITGTSLPANVQNITRVFGDWSIRTEGQAERLDQLFRAAQGSGVGIEQLSTKVVQFGAPLRALGFDFEQALAIISKFDKEGVNTEAVLAGLKVGLSKFARSGEEPAEVFARLLEEIKNAPSELEATSLAFEAFGGRAGIDVAKAIREGRFELQDMLEVIVGGSDTINKAAKDTESFGEMFQLLKNDAFLALKPVALEVYELLENGAKSLRGAFDFFSDLPKGVQGAVVGFIGLGVAATVVVGALSLAAGAALRLTAAYTALSGSATIAATRVSAVGTAASAAARFLGPAVLVYAAKAAGDAFNDSTRDLVEFETVLNRLRNADDAEVGALLLEGSEKLRGDLDKLRDFAPLELLNRLFGSGGSDPAVIVQGVRIELDEMRTTLAELARQDPEQLARAIELLRNAEVVDGDPTTLSRWNAELDRYRESIDNAAAAERRLKNEAAPQTGFDRFILKPFADGVREAQRRQEEAARSAADLGDEITKMGRRAELSTVGLRAAAAAATAFTASLDASSSVDNVLRAGLGTGTALRAFRDGFKPDPVVQTGNAADSGRAKRQTDGLRTAIDELGAAVRRTDPAMSSLSRRFDELGAAAGGFRTSLERSTSFTKEINAALELGTAYKSFSRSIRRIPAEVDLVGARSGCTPVDRPRASRRSWLSARLRRTTSPPSSRRARAPLSFGTRPTGCEAPSSPSSAVSA
jgi:hypothetical protein